MDHERVKFRLIVTPCCGAQLCWVNPRLPNYCPECGEKIFMRLKFGSEGILLVDDQAVLSLTTKVITKAAGNV